MWPDLMELRRLGDVVSYEWILYAFYGGEA